MKSAFNHIRRLSEKDLPRALDVFELCKQSMYAQEIYQWNENYPNAAVILNDIRQEECFGLFKDDWLGLITLNTKQEVEYESVKWHQTAGEVLVVHRLAVLPSVQRQSVGSALMDFTEAFAKQNGFTSIRLDTYSGNPKAVHFYERRGYIKRGEVFFEGRKLPFYCYEKTL
jgi:ribosomal protein S18 acetylase RimI-like enzyme